MPAALMYFILVRAMSRRDVDDFVCLVVVLIFCSSKFAFSKNLSFFIVLGLLIFVVHIKISHY